MLPPLLWNILLLIPVAMVLVVPFVAAMFSRQASGWCKVGWVVAALLLSWPGYFLYYYVAVRRRERA